LRLAHATDLHWLSPPPLRRLLGKRLIGSANLYLNGRRHHFNAEVQAAAVAQLLAMNADAVILTGDLTAQALPEEFEAAKVALQPLLDRLPTLVQCGNHDVYTRGARRDRRMEATFGPWMHLRPDGLAAWSQPGLTVVGLDPNRPHLLASGVVPEAQLAALPAALAAAPADHALVLALHYPLLDRHGAVYDHWEHGLRNARALIDVLRASPRRPDAILHGHVHHGYRAALDLGDVVIPTFNPGSGGYAWRPAEDRAAAVNVYTLNAGQPVQVERFRFDGERFAPEAGGAYASGR
jgi:3',5'-cyclic AMP phosphodiesterase CpdA